MSKLQSLLASGQGIVNALAVETDTTAMTQALVAAAQSSSKMFETASTAEIRQLLRRIVVAVVVSEASIEIRLNKHSSREALLGIDSTRKPDSLTGFNDHRQVETVSLVIEASVKRCGGEMRLILEGASSGAPARIVPSKTKAVARARQWYEQIVRGELSGGRAISKQEGCDERYVSLIMRCAFLAPDIVEATLDGKQPPDLTLAKITARLPMDWGEQRRLLGIK